MGWITRKEGKYKQCLKEELGETSGDDKMWKDWDKRSGSRVGV